MKKLVYLSLGSNLGDRGAHLLEAIRKLADLGQAIAVSAFYETEPMDVDAQQPWYLNCAVAIKTELMPVAFLRHMLQIEQAMGRERVAPKAPRIIDIDIVLWGCEVLDTSELTVPHPAMHQRRFVLEPLAEIAPEAIHPVFQRSVRELLDLLPASTGSVRRVSAGDLR